MVMGRRAKRGTTKVRIGRREEEEGVSFADVLKEMLEKEEREDKRLERRIERRRNNLEERMKKEREEKK